MPNNKILNIQLLVLSPQLLKVIHHLPKTGKIKITAGCFAYLDIDDCFIHSIYPLLDYPGIVKPDYFGEEADYIGAHISIVYPEENTQLDQGEGNKQITFNVEGLFTADLVNKRYFALKVDAPDLVRIRRKYGLGNTLQLKGYSLDPHITIATSNI